MVAIFIISVPLYFLLYIATELVNFGLLATYKHPYSTKAPTASVTLSDLLRAMFTMEEDSEYYDDDFSEYDEEDIYRQECASEFSVTTRDSEIQDLDEEAVHKLHDAGYNFDMEDVDLNETKSVNIDVDEEFDGKYIHDNRGNKEDVCELSVVSMDSN